MSPARLFGLGAISYEPPPYAARLGLGGGPGVCHQRSRQSRDAQRGNEETFTLYADTFFASLEGPECWGFVLIGWEATDGVGKDRRGSQRAEG